MRVPIPHLLAINQLNPRDNMLVAYLPKDNVVVNADLWDPPPAERNLAT